MNQTSQQIIALAALIQACDNVDQLARHGQASESQCQVLIDSLFILNPEDGSDIYQDITALKPGLDKLKAILSQGDNKQFGALIRYALGAIHLQNKLTKRDDLLNILSSRLQHIGNHRPANDDDQRWFDHCHQLSGVYQDTVSTLAFRLQIMGNANYLKQTSYSEKIRSLLLCAIRASVLWRQSGGHRWHLLFKRKGLIRQIDLMLENPKLD